MRGWAVANGALRGQVGVGVTAGFSELQRTEDALLNELAVRLAAGLLDDATEEHEIDVRVFAFVPG
jgi:hypothetical protein